MGIRPVLAGCALGQELGAGARPLAPHLPFFPPRPSRVCDLGVAPVQAGLRTPRAVICSCPFSFSNDGLLEGLPASWELAPHKQEVFACV